MSPSSSSLVVMGSSVGLKLLLMKILFSSSTEPARPMKDVNISSCLRIASLSYIENSYILSNTDCVRIRHIYEGVRDNSILPVSVSGILTA